MPTSKHPQSPRRIALAGPIGSGKSRVGAMLAEHGAMVIEADRIGHEVLEPDGAAYPAVSARWPEVVVAGRIDRAKLAAIVFADEHGLRVLEALTHPHIAAQIEQRAEGAGDRLVAVELPLLIDLMGPGWPRLVVIAAPDLRLARAVGRGMDEEDVRRRMAAQPPEEQWRASATWVLSNDGTLESLRAAVDDWWRASNEPTG